jgi:hypothetical protein
MRGLSNDIHCHISYGDIRVAMVAEGCSWSPDVARDITNRTSEVWHNTLLELYRFGMLEQPSDEDYEDDDEDDEINVVFDEKLIHERIVRLEGEDG